jgi:hypothetical protein
MSLLSWSTAQERVEKVLSVQAFRFGDEEARTPDPLLAKQVLYQLSYIPVCCLRYPEAFAPFPSFGCAPCGRSALADGADDGDGAWP